MKIAIIGTGNVAYHLIRKFSETSSTVLFIQGRNKATLLELQQEFPDIRLISNDAIQHTQAELVLLCVKDDALNEVFQRYQYPAHAVVAHTSGSQIIQNPDHHSFTGVFYPLQSFSRSAPLHWNKTPLLLEANSENGFSVLEKAATLLNAPYFEVNSQQRQRIHLAAVITSNFINHLIGKARDLLQNDHIDYHILQPLIEETIRKSFGNDPYSVQTGPAIRHDETIITKHLTQLKGDALLQKIYSNITESIQKAVI